MYVMRVGEKMNLARTALLMAALWLLPFRGVAQEQPVALPDTLFVDEDHTLQVPPPGILSNDRSPFAFQAMLQGGAPRGMLVLDSLGGVTYTPAGDFFGEERFQYIARYQHPGVDATLAVDSSASAMTLDASLTTLLGTGSDAGNSAVAGTVGLSLLSQGSAYIHAHIHTLQLRFLEGLSLRFRFRSGIITLGSVQATAQPDSLTVDMIRTGRAGAISGTSFVQANNEVGFQGGVTLRGTGLAAGAVPEDPLTIDTSATLDVTGILDTDAQVMRLVIPVDLPLDIDIDGNALKGALRGTLVAKAPWPAAGMVAAASAPAEVVLVVHPVNDAPTAASLTLPAPEATLNIGGDPGTRFGVAWTAATDVEGAALAYEWQLAGDTTFATPILAIDVGEATHLETDYGTLGAALTGAGVLTGTTHTFYHRVVVSDGDLTTAGSAQALVVTRGGLTAADDTPAAFSFGLDPVYPNPVTTSATLSYAIDRPASVRLALYDILGREVAVLAEGFQPVGVYDLRFSAGDLAPGLYLVLLRAGHETATQRIIIRP